MSDTEDVDVEKSPENDVHDNLEEEEDDDVEDDVEEEEEDLDEDGSPRRTAKALDESWDESFNKLLKFRAKHGHCNVPSRFPGDPHLGSWVATQRRQYRIMVSGSGLSTPMTESRARRLEGIGFKWSSKDPRHIPWEARYDELMSFVKKYGHAQVPIGWTENVSLANWVSTQRQEYKLLQKGRSNRLTPERMRLLNEAGFIWEAQRGGPRRLKKARVSVPARATPKPPSRNRGVRGGAAAAVMPRGDPNQMRGMGSSDAVLNRMQESANALNQSAVLSTGNVGQTNQDATLQLLINQQQALLESQRRNAALLTAMQPQLGMQGMSIGGLATANQFAVPGSAFIMPQQFTALPILYAANGMPFQLQPLAGNPFTVAQPGLPQNVFSNMAAIPAAPIVDQSQLAFLQQQQQQNLALQQAQSGGDIQNQTALLQGLNSTQPNGNVMSPSAVASIALPPVTAAALRSPSANGSQQQAKHQPAAVVQNGYADDNSYEDDEDRDED